MAAGRRGEEGPVLLSVSLSREVSLLRSQSEEEVSVLQHWRNLREGARLWLRKEPKTQTGGGTCFAKFLFTRLLLHEKYAPYDFCNPKALA